MTTTTRRESIPTCPPSHEDIFLGDDIFGLYRHDTKKYKRIDNDTMLVHVERLQEGVAAQKELDSNDHLSIGEREELQRKADAGVEARNSIVVANTGLVFKWARINRAQGVDEEDLIQEGNLALMRAAELFDPYNSAGAQFSSYATRRIRADIAKAVHNMSRTIRIPQDKSFALKSLKKIEERYFEEEGSKIPSIELAAEMNLSLEAVEDLRSIEKEILSLNYDYDNGVDDNPELVNYISDSSSSDFDEKIIKCIDTLMKRDVLQKICDDSGLSEDERELLWLKFAEDQDPENIAKMYALSKATVSRLANVALRKIQKNFENTNKKQHFIQLLEESNE